jgi:hypothetical protein
MEFCYFHVVMVFYGGGGSLGLLPVCVSMTQKGTACLVCYYNALMRRVLFLQVSPATLSFLIQRLVYLSRLIERIQPRSLTLGQFTVRFSGRL